MGVVITASAVGFSMDREFRMRWLREAQRSHGKNVRFAGDSPLEEAGFELPVPLEIGALRPPKIAREL